jgi:hypothetical protein
MVRDDCMQIDSAEFEIGLRDMEAVADTLKLLASLGAEQLVMVEEEHRGHMSSALRVLGDYLDIRSQQLRSIGRPI